jgi:hypothetical protein
VFIPKCACWLNLQQAWWRLFRRQGLAGQCFANADEIIHAIEVATAQHNQHARPWIWGRPPHQPGTVGDGWSTSYEERGTSLNGRP